MRICEDNIETDLREIRWRAWTGLIWLIATSCRVLWTL